jgi:hypothetical protein
MRSTAQAELLNRIMKDPLESHIYLAAASEELKADKEIVMAVVQRNGHALMDASASIKSDPEVVFAACCQNAHALKYAAPHLQSDKELVGQLAFINFHVLRFAAEAIRADKDFMLRVVEGNSNAFMYVADALKDDVDMQAAQTTHTQSVAQPCSAGDGVFGRLGTCDGRPPVTALHKAPGAALPASRCADAPAGAWHRFRLQLRQTSYEVLGHLICGVPCSA